MTADAETRRLARGDRLVLATHNAGKLAELRTLAAPYSIEIVSAGELNLLEPDETGETFEANARLKAHAARDATGLIALADDSGLSVDALQGRPGVHSARYAGPEKDFTGAMARLNAELDEAGIPPEDRTAFFSATLVLAWPDGVDARLEGRVDGRIVAARGSNGFGYDPSFYVPDLGRTFGEATPEEKRARSHRARAFDALAERHFPVD